MTLWPGHALAAIVHPEVFLGIAAALVVFDAVGVVILLGRIVVLVVTRRFKREVGEDMLGQAVDRGDKESCS